MEFEIAAIMPELFDETNRREVGSGRITGDLAFESGKPSASPSVASGVSGGAVPFSGRVTIADQQPEPAKPKGNGCPVANLAIVLIQIWEHLRGYHNWTPTKATVQSSTLSKFEVGGKDSKQALAWQSVCKIIWRDQNQVPHTAEFTVFEETPLYQLCEGDTVDIRFNPTKPDQFYLPGLIQSKLAWAWKLTVFAVLFVLVQIAWFGPEIINAILR